MVPVNSFVTMNAINLKWQLKVKEHHLCFTKTMLYKTWKNKLKMWQPIVVLLDSLESDAKAEKAVADIRAEEINNDGIKVITDELDLNIFI